MHTSASSALLAAIASAQMAFGGACKSPDKGDRGAEAAFASATEAAGNRAPPRPPVPVDIDVELRGVPGDVAETAVRAAIDRLRPELARCYVGRMGARPGLAGTDVFDVTRRESGFVAQVATTEMKDAPVARCLIARLGELELAAPAPERFQLALTFTPRAEVSP